MRNPPPEICAAETLLGANNGAGPGEYVAQPAEVIVDALGGVDNVEMAWTE